MRHECKAKTMRARHTNSRSWRSSTSSACRS